MDVFAGYRKSFIESELWGLWQLAQENILPSRFGSRAGSLPLFFFLDPPSGWPALPKPEMAWGDLFTCSWQPRQSS
jgi:hypothetical protein